MSWFRKDPHEDCVTVSAYNAAIATWDARYNLQVAETEMWRSTAKGLDAAVRRQREDNSRPPIIHHSAEMPYRPWFGPGSLYPNYVIGNNGRLQYAPFPLPGKLYPIQTPTVADAREKDLREQLDNADRHLAQARQQRDDARAEAEEARTHRTELIGDNARLRRERGEARMTVVDLDKKLRGAEAELNGYRASDRIAVRLRKERDEARAEVSRLTEQAHLDAQQINRLHRKWDDVEPRSEGLVRRDKVISEQASEISKLRAELSDWRSSRTLFPTATPPRVQPSRYGHPRGYCSVCHVYHA